jgi:hypothetical protein
MTTFIFPSDVFKPRLVDEAFRDQAEAIQALGGNIAVFDYEALTAGLEDRRFVAKGLEPHTGEKDVVYRGWMLTVHEYSFLEASLRNRGIKMKTVMPDYQKAHQLPGWYDAFREITPKTAWRYQNQQESLGSLTDGLNSESFIVKDFVKSRKSEWDTACFAANKDLLPSVADEFIRLQVEDGTLVGGLVIREFEDLNHEEGEARIWWVNGEPVLITSHPDNPGVLPLVDETFIEKIRASVNTLSCPFITTDVALRHDGQWRVIEAGDGQVSGLPYGADATDLWKALIR